MKQIRLYISTWIWIVGILAWTVMSCGDNDTNNSPGATTSFKVYKVAVIMPAQQQNRWLRIASWALTNIETAQKELSKGVRLQLEWKDESADDLSSYMQQIAEDSTYVAVIGPQSSTNAGKIAQLCARSKKTLILPIATSTEFQRLYADCDYVWNMTQSDITQCELMLMQVKLSDKIKVNLITGNSDYGKSFSDWFAFQATELGLNIGDVIVYNNEQELRNAVDMFAGRKYYYDEAILFAPDTEDEAVVFDEEYGKLKGDDDYMEYPSVICSDIMNSSTLASRLTHNTYEGLSPSAAPESGFLPIYLAKFGEEPMAGEANLFDSFLLLAYALTYQSNNPNETLNEAILKVVDGRDTWCGGWLKDDMYTAFSLIGQGKYIDLSGVTGDWTFDERTHASVLNTTYSHWILHNGKYSTIEFLSTDGGVRTTSSLQAWQWQTQKMQEFNPSQKDFQYGEVKDHWAVIVGASDTWAYYRHQADALAMYQLLKRHGYDDDHIILVLEDNIAFNPKNIHQGEIRVRPDGENLYQDVEVDYKLSDIRLQDLKNIMLGKRSENLTEVIESSGNDNIIMFWCGHGNRNQLVWGSHGNISSYDIEEIFSSMHAENKYRKIFFALDACYSGSIGKACEGIPGVILFTAANELETSRADMKDYEMGVWLSNGFTRAFQETIDENTKINLCDLYYSLARHTVGSHANVYNVEYYGNIYQNTMSEYLQ